jgi:SNF2 family DNA or RNA helicase
MSHSESHKLEIKLDKEEAAIRKNSNMVNGKWVVRGSAGLTAGVVLVKRKRLEALDLPFLERELAPVIQYFKNSNEGEGTSSEGVSQMEDDTFGSQGKKKTVYNLDSDDDDDEDADTIDSMKDFIDDDMDYDGGAIDGDSDDNGKNHSKNDSSENLLAAPSSSSSNKGVGSGPGGGKVLGGEKIDVSNIDEEDEEDKETAKIINDLKVPHDWWRLAERKDQDQMQPKGPYGQSRDKALDDGEILSLGNKIVAFLALLALSVNEGDKVLLFSQSVPTLNFIELCLNQSQWGKAVGIDDCKVDGLKFSRWQRGRNFARITGVTKPEERQKLINQFNHPQQGKNLRLFLISTKAGNMGINLVSANRVVIFDSSWNPANDLQAIYRVYRYGQKKNVFVYRLLASGIHTMILLYI